jgi:hypothetical protein
VNEGQGVVIDGYFGDWNDIEKHFDVISNAESEHVDLEQYAAVTQDESTFMYMSVDGNILNGIAIPAYNAKSMPDLNTGSTGDTEPTPGVSNQESTPLPVISSEDTIYVLIDTDNNPMTGYSSIGMSIGAEKMIEIKGHYGIITQRVLKEWTGSDGNDWEWATGEIVDAAASGNEIELEVVDGDFWIHIVGWNGDQDTSLSFESIENGGRYVDVDTCNMYYRFNGDLTDVCAGTGGGTLSASGDASVSSAGKMGNGLTLDGSGDYATGSFGSINLASDWSIEAWIKPATIGEGTIFSISNSDDSEDNHELSIQLGASDELQVCEGTGQCSTTSGNLVGSEDTWYHIAVTHDYTSLFSDDVDLYVNNDRVKADDAFVSFVGTPSGSIVIEIGTGDDDNGGDFEGIIDDVRMLNYQRMAFAGGIMLSKVVPSTDVVHIYNAADAAIDLTGIKLMFDTGDSQCGSFSGTLAAGATTSVTCSHNLGADDAVYLIDIDGDNSGGSDSGAGDTMEWAIDAVCWNDGGGSAAACNGPSDVIIAAGLWTEDVYMDLSEGDGDTLHLSSNGNNDEADADWFVPEFSTLLMPIASVLLIVGYNYTRRETLD